MRVHEALSKPRLPALIFLIAALLTVSFTGCEEDAVCYPVRGRLFVGKAPLAEALVVLHPLANGTALVQKPVAYTDSAGRFAVSTYEPGDGAPPGKYAITIELRAPRVVGEETIRDGRNLLPSRFADPTTSGLECLVEARQNEVPAIRLP